MSPQKHTPYMVTNYNIFLLILLKSTFEMCPNMIMASDANLTDWNGCCQGYEGPKWQSASHNQMSQKLTMISSALSHMQHHLEGSSLVS